MLSVGRKAGVEASPPWTCDAHSQESALVRRGAAGSGQTHPAAGAAQRGNVSRIEGCLEDTFPLSLQGGDKKAPLLGGVARRAGVGRPRIDTPAGALYREGMEEYEALARAAVAALQGANQPKWTDVLAAKTLIERTATRN